MRGLKVADRRSAGTDLVAFPAERMDERASQKSVLCVAKVPRSVRDAWIKGCMAKSMQIKSIGRIPRRMRGLKE